MTVLEKAEKIRVLFGKKIRDLRIARGLTQDNLAFEIGLASSRQIRKIENGEVFVNLRTIVRLSEALETPLQDLFDFVL